MSRIDSAYDYYISTYAGRQASRYDTHKKSELRKVYNDIVKTNKDSPLYKISNLESAKRYAIDIKENAKSIQNVVASLSDSSTGDSLQKKVAFSSDENLVNAIYVGDNPKDNPVDEFHLQIHQLASPQTNTGNYLSEEALSFIPGLYSFDLTTKTSSYEFQYVVSPGERNIDIVRKLSNLINHSNVGIDAQILSNEKGRSALSLTSHQTGLTPDEEHLFSISPSADAESIGAMNLLGINQITELPQNASFTLNGDTHSSVSNHFTVNDMFELTLKGVTDENSSLLIGFKRNTEAVADNIQNLVDAYNGIIDTAKNYADNHNSTADNPSDKAKAPLFSEDPNTDNASSFSSGKLLRDMNSLTRHRRATLESIGLLIAEDGKITIDRDKLTQSIESENSDDTFAVLTQLKDDLGKKAASASIDPMNYVDKVVVVYKNPEKNNFNTPYITSVYSGLMMDKYM